MMSKRIMVVDDEEFCISTMQIILQLAGVDTSMQVDFCISGEEALSCFTKAYANGFKYKLILTDFSMPVMDGIEATKLIRQHLSNTSEPNSNQPTIIGITGHVQETFKAQGLKAGMDDILSKPVNLA